MWASGYQAPPGAVFHECHSGLRVSTDILHLGGFLLSSKRASFEFMPGSRLSIPVHVSSLWRLARRIVLGKVCKSSELIHLQETEKEDSFGNWLNRKLPLLCTTYYFYALFSENSQPP